MSEIAAVAVPTEDTPPPPKAGAHGRNFSMTLATNVGIAVLTLATGSISARLLGPTGRGELSAIQTIPSFLGMLALFGLPSAVAYFSAKDPLAARSLTLTAMMMGAISALVVIALGAMVMPWALGHQSVETVHNARIYLLFILLQAFQSVPYLALQGLGRFRIWNLLRLAPNLVWLLTLAIGWLLGHGEAGWLSRGYLVGYSLTIPLVAGTLWLSTSGANRIARERIGPMLKYGAPSAAAALPSSLNLRLDQMLMAAILAPNLLGLYAVGVSWSGAMAPVFGALGSTVFPALAASREAESKAKMVGRVVRLAIVLALLLGTALAAITPLVFPLLFGARFVGAMVPTLVLIGAAIILSVNSVLEDTLRGLGGPAWTMYAQFVALPITVLILTTTLSRWQLMSAAVASLASYFAAGVTMLMGVRRLTGLPVTTLLRPQSGDVELMRQTVGSAWQRVRKSLAAA